MLRKELSRLDVSLSKPYKAEIPSLTKGKYVLRIIHQCEAVFKRPKSMFFTFSIKGNSPQNIRNILGLRDISTQYGVFTYVGGGQERAGYFIKEIVLNITQDVKCMEIELRTFLPNIGIFIDALQIYDTKISYLELYGNDFNSLFFKEDETISFNLFGQYDNNFEISLKEIDTLSLKSFEIDRDRVKKIFLEDVEKGIYSLKIRHEDKVIFEKQKSLFFAFTISGIENASEVKDILGLPSISNQHGAFSYVAAGNFQHGEYQQEVILNITQDVSELVVELCSFNNTPTLIKGLKLEKLEVSLDSSKSNSLSLGEDLTYDEVKTELKPKVSQNKVESLLSRDWVLENMMLNKFPKTSVRIACILDGFTFNSYKYECDLQQLSRDNWFADLERIQPQMLFVESAWRGKDEQWYNVINKNIDELQEIVKWCNNRNIPTVFWNKEDPIHFQTFINTAQQFDYVFTTDLDCLSNYKEVLGHQNIYFLPFACQPVVNNPIELYKREDTFCFAGAYYAKYPERTIDLENIVKALGDFKGVDIYDRNFYKTDQDYMFPDEYSSYIVGNLPFEEIDKAYKGYKYSINLNSIKQSQTMFARRVYELLGSNTLTVSNFSRGIRTIFGDLVFVSDSGEELVKRLESVLASDLKYGKFRLLGLRKVMLEHTYEQRLNYILSKALPTHDVKPYLPDVSIISVVRNDVEVKKAIDQFELQQYQNKTLILIDENSKQRKIEKSGIKFYKLKDIKDKTLSEITGSQYLSLFNIDDYYGPNYLLDLALATKYTQAEVIGKSMYFEKKKNVISIKKGKAYSPVEVLFAATSLVLKDIIYNMSIQEYITNPSFEFERMLSIDPYNYCRDGVELSDIEKMDINDLALNEGFSLSELIEQENNTQCLETQMPFKNEKNKSEKSADDSLDIYSDELEKLFYSQNKALIKNKRIDDIYVIQSSMDLNQHDYLYSSELIDINIINKDDDIFYLKCYGKNNLDIQIVILFYSHTRERLKHQIEDVNQFIPIKKDENIGYIQLGWRVKGSGHIEIEKLSFYRQNHQAVKCSYIVNEILTPDKIQNVFKSEGSKSVQLTYSDNDGYVVQSFLEDEKHEYIYAKNTLKLSDISTKDAIPLYLDAGAGLDIQLVCFFLNEKKQRIGHQIDYPRRNTVIKPVAGTDYLLLGWRVRGAGSVMIKSIYFKEQNFNPNIVFGNSDVLVLTNNYPSYSDLYKNAFVHSRVKAYKNEGLEVDVFQFCSQDIALSYDEFEDIDIIKGSPTLLDSIIKTGKYKKILVHFLDASMWAVLQKYIDDIQVIVWIHGSDIQPWWRRKFNYEDKSELELEPIKQASVRKEHFWKELLSNSPENLSFVFVSQQFAEEVMQDYKVRLPKDKYNIIHNYIDSSAFKYEEKHPDMRKNILSIRPFASKTYANDLTVKAILELSKESWFHELNFTIIGDGILFDELTAPIKGFPNVRLEKRFLNQQEIIEEHKKHGVFLVPTRMDTQGVSRGEAMSSGLVAITNKVAAIPEFCSDEDTMIVEPEDYLGLVKSIKELYFNIGIFKEFSKNSFYRVSKQCSYGNTILKETSLIYNYE